MSIKDKVLDILEELCGDSIVREKLDINLIDEELMDSIDYAELIVEFEKVFGIVISPSEVSREDSDTPEKIIRVVESRIK